MKAFDVQEHKFLIAQKYKIPEGEIDESVLAIYILIDSMNEEGKERHAQQKEEIDQALGKMMTFQAKKFQAITYEDPRTAFWGNFGSKGILGVSACLAIIVVAITFTSWYESRQLVKNLELLKSHVKVTDDGYFINQKSYTVVKNGVIIKP